MVSLLGIYSTRTREHDVLGREHHRLILSGLGLLARTHPLSYDVADLDHLVQGTADVIPSEALSHWTDGLARALVPWAVVHVAVSAPVVASLHGDGLCTLANIPEASSAVEAALWGEVGWLTGAPGPALARAVASQSGPAALVPGLGLLAWGSSSEAVLARAEAYEQQARRWLADGGFALTGEAPVASTTDERLSVDADSERELVVLRGQLSHDRPRVLHVDPSFDGLARRPDAGHVVAIASELEPFWPWATRSGLAPSERGLAGLGTLVVAGLGLVSIGADEPEAHDRGLVSAHGHRVAAVLAEGPEAPAASGRRAEPAPEPEPAPESTPMAELRGRVYIVTGAASGIGRDIARHLASLGAQLVLADVSGEGLEAVADELDGHRGRPLTIAGDLTDEGVVDHVVSATVSRFGGVDGGVLNVGVALPGELTAITTTDWQRSLEVNATSHFLLLRRLLPVLEAQGLGGSLVFIGSKNMFSPGAGFGAYSASKAALAQLARLVAIEAGPYGVRSNIVNPDNVFQGSALWSPELRAQRAAVYGVKPADLEAFYTQRNLMKVPISGTDVAKAVAFLLSDDAAKTTACILTVDGGVPGVFPR